MGSYDEGVLHNHIPCEEDGLCYYGNNTRASREATNQATKLVNLAINEIPFNNGQAFTVCDYGAADGLASLNLIRTAIELIRKRQGENTEIHVIYEDQPVADFKSLFYSIHGLVPSSERSYLLDYDHVFVSAVATPFYAACHPSNSIQLGYSAVATHWLSRRPCCLRNVWHVNICESESERRCFAAQAAKDWEKFLLLRQRELAPGGQLVLVCLATDKHGQASNKTRWVRHSTYTVLNDIWRSMREEGKISQEEFEDTTSNDYHRTAEEFSAPFEDVDSPVYRSGLRLHSIDIHTIRSPYHLDWLRQQTNDTSAAKEHAKNYVPSIRVWSHSVFKTALSDVRSEAEKTALLEELYIRFEQEVAASPDDHGADIVCAYLRIENTTEHERIEA